AANVHARFLRQRADQWHQPIPVTALLDEQRDEIPELAFRHHGLRPRTTQPRDFLAPLARGVPIQLTLELRALMAEAPGPPGLDPGSLPTAPELAVAPRFARSRRDRTQRPPGARETVVRPMHRRFAFPGDFRLPLDRAQPWIRDQRRLALQVGGAGQEVFTSALAKHAYRTKKAARMSDGEDIAGFG